MAIYCSNLFLYPSNTIDRASTVANNESCLNFMFPVNMQEGHGWKCIDPWPIWPIDPLFTLDGGIMFSGCPSVSACVTVHEPGQRHSPAGFMSTSSVLVPAISRWLKVLIHRNRRESVPINFSTEGNRDLYLFSMLPRLWNQLPASLRQPRINFSYSNSPLPMTGILSTHHSRHP